ncbi:hypothetical protein B0181_10560 [Moraxella caviae]|uniref:Glutamate 5-kinase n=1 Tax=Moraxella caviae TaxID=34060 RepID=A0A1S9ZV64_9GAMM|nr:hypothetical protein [Moraxella caviae]OOR87283.1 hypothetical protein B0181_10560 [Moraxella caviae]STZ14051.1 Uncharacterised protein [Moraxella caviae]
MIKALINQNIAKAFDGVLKDAIKDFIGEAVTATGDYNPVTGGYDSTKTTYQGRGSFGSFTQDELMDGMDINDVKLICLVKEISDTPKIDDVIHATLLGKLKAFKVLSVKTDNAETVYTIALRGLDVG